MATLTRSSLRTRVEAGLAASSDVGAIAAAVFETVGAEVPFVFACVATVDPASGLITRALKSSPLEIGDQDFTAAEYGEPDINQFAELAERPVPVGALWLDTGGMPSRCRRFRDYMAPVFGFTDELRVACRSGSTMWGAIALYRGQGDAPFTRREADLVAGVHDLVAVALMRTLTAAGEPAAEPMPPTVLVLSESNCIESRSGPVEALIEGLGGWDSADLPASMLAVASAARTAGAAVTSQIRTGSGDWVAARAVPVSTSSGVRSVVLTVETPPSAAIGRLRLAARGLTAREMDIVRQVLLGASTKEMALELHLSAHTVQDHLKAVFAKLGIGSRRELIAQFVG